MSATLPSALSLALLTLAAFPGQDRRTSPELPRDPGPRTEYFLLEIHGELAKPGPSAARIVGTACLRRRTLESGFQLEGEWTFDRSEEEGGSEHVLHIERIADGGSRLIWREWGASHARSLTVERDAGKKLLASVDSARGGTHRETLAARESAWMPLELLERIRHGGSLLPACERLDPLARSLERVEVKLLSSGVATPDVRIIEIVRADGTIAGRYEFLGLELRSFRWQEGDLFARRVGEEEYRTRSARSAVTIRRP